MTSPSDSARLFFSSSPTRYSSGPAEEVDAILAQVQQVDQLDPSINATVAVNRDAFFETFSRRVELIKSRSQAFQDSHITVFDKVLLVLTQNGKELDTAAAISYFCEEHLGIPKDAPSAQKKAIVSNALIAPATLTQAMSPPETRRGSMYTRDAGSSSPEKKTLFNSGVASNSAVFAALAAQVGGHMVRLWTVYDKAKKDFFAVTDPNSLRKQETAKFLRDTAENVLHHIRDKRVDQRLLDELSTTFDLAKHTAMTLHGGKKRKFDQPPAAALPTREPRPNSIDTMRANARIDGRPSTTERAPQRRDFPGRTQAQALFSYGQEDVDIQRSKDQRQFFAPEVSPQNARAPKQRKKHQGRGRGHSGVPYGYTRQVDSYYPP